MALSCLSRAWGGASLLLAASALSAGLGDDAFVRRRADMVRSQVEARGVADKRVLAAMTTVPRHLFVLPGFLDQAYEDHPLPIDEGQTISQPYIVALMTECLGLQGGERVLEVGTGSGYQAAVLAGLVKDVYSLEIREGLARRAGETLSRLGYGNVHVKCGDGYFGWEEAAPFEAIIVTCAADHVPPPLLRQLKEGGRLVIPLGSTLYFQTLTLITKKDGKPTVRQLLDVRFVPMTGETDKKRGDKVKPPRQE